MLDQVKIIYFNYIKFKSELKYINDHLCSIHFIYNKQGF